MKNLFIIILILYANLFLAQKQNNNWINGNRLWNFNNTSTGDFVDSSISTGNTFKQSVSNVSDRNTGNLLFYTNSLSIYNKNHAIMENGEELFGPNTTISMPNGNNAAQGSLIIPFPGEANKYYVFYLQSGYSGLGLRYAVVDMSYNSGLGKVLSKNTLLINNANVNSMTSCISNDGGYWLVTQNNTGNFLSYKITASQGISTPVISNQAFGLATEGLKISPNTHYLFEITNRYLFNFDNSNGNVTFFKSFGFSRNDLYNPSSAEFSEDSNVLYFLNVKALFYDNVRRYRTEIGKYIISSGQGYESESISTSTGIYKSIPGSVQRHPNGNIYIKFYDNTYNYTDNRWYKLTDTNSTSLYYFNVQEFYYNYTSHGYTFPQLVEYPPECTNTLNITQNITSNGNYKASNQITASSSISPNLIVNFAAGNQISLLPGFQVNGNSTGIFRAYLQECNPYGLVPEPANRNSSKSPEVLENTNNLKIYPNPVSNILTIDNGKEKLISWQLYDVSGKLMKNGNSNIVDVQSIPNASYVLKINLEKTQISKTIIVKH